jgi:hypothetical protein
LRTCDDASDCTLPGNICYSSTDPPLGYCKPEELCANGTDDDGDALYDCADDECFEATECKVQCVAAPTLPVPTLYDGDTSTGTNTADGSCEGTGSDENIFKYTAPSDGTLRLTLYSGTDQGLYIRTDCNFGELACADSAAPGDPETLDVAVTAGTSYFIFVDGYQATEEGPYQLETSFFDTATFCASPPSLPASGTGDTTAGTPLPAASCNDGGLADLYVYTPPMNGLLEIQMASVTDQGLVVKASCNGAELDCQDMVAAGGTETAYVVASTAQTYYVFVQAYNGLEAGPYEISYDLLPMAEDCGDGIDNDNDNTLDCADTDCFNDPHCGGCDVDGMCGIDDACTCDDCIGSVSCICVNDGVCDQYNEGCDCADCLNTAPNCP